MAAIKETKEMVMFMAKLASGLGAAAADGKLDFLDVAKLAPVLMRAGDAMSGMEMIPAELADLDAEEREELIAMFAAEFSWPEGEIEELIEKCMAAVGKLHEIYMMFK